MEFSQAFANVLRERRKELKLSQEALAGRVDSNQRYISEIESSAKNPTIKFSHELAKALEIPLSTLISNAELKVSSASHQ